MPTLLSLSSNILYSLSYRSAGPAATCCETPPLLDLSRGEAAPEPLPMVHAPPPRRCDGACERCAGGYHDYCISCHRDKAACMVGAGTATAAATVSLGPCDPGGCAWCRRATATVTMAWCGRPEATTAVQSKRMVHRAASSRLWTLRP